jgi:hypothetical protein
VILREGYSHSFYLFFVYARVSSTNLKTTMKTTMEIPSENVVNLFNLFVNLPADQQQNSLKTYDKLLASCRPEDAEFFTELKSYLLEVNK